MIPIDQLPPAQSLKTAMIVVTVTPVLCVYPFIQRYFVKGVMIAACRHHTLSLGREATHMPPMSPRYAVAQDDHVHI